MPATEPPAAVAEPDGRPDSAMAGAGGHSDACAPGSSRPCGEHSQTSMFGTRMPADGKTAVASLSRHGVAWILASVAAASGGTSHSRYRISAAAASRYRSNLGLAPPLGTQSRRQSGALRWSAAFGTSPQSRMGTVSKPKGLWDAALSPICNADCDADAALLLEAVGRTGGSISGQGLPAHPTQFDCSRTYRT